CVSPPDPAAGRDGYTSPVPTCWCSSSDRSPSCPFFAAFGVLYRPMACSHVPANDSASSGHRLSDAVDNGHPSGASSGGSPASLAAVCRTTRCDGYPTDRTADVHSQPGALAPHNDDARSQSEFLQAFF